MSFPSTLSKQCRQDARILWHFVPQDLLEVKIGVPHRPAAVASLAVLSQAGRADLERVGVLRALSNHDREPPGESAAESLQEMVSANYSPYRSALEAAETAGHRVVRDLVEHWADRPSAIPHAP